MYRQDDKGFALKLAKLAILNEFDNSRYLVPDQIPGVLKDNKACFVTLKKKFDDLRGCIGSLQATKPLYEDIRINAKNAAFSDPRFMPLSIEEISSDEDLKIEISVLTDPMVKEFASIGALIEFLDKEKPGLIIRKGYYQATFLPSVWEQLPDVKDFINHLVSKSGYSPNKFWKEEPLSWDYEIYYANKWERKFSEIDV